MAQAGDLLLEPFRRRLADYATLDFTAGLKAVPAVLGADAGLIGVAGIARDLSHVPVKTAS